MPAGRISFVTALHNCLPLTQAMLGSLEATVPLDRHQVVLVDDGSSDGTPAFLQTLQDRPNFRILSNADNLGYAASNNRGAAAASGEIIVFLNNDLEFAPGWLEPMLELLRTLPSAGAVGNVQRNFATGLVDHAGIFFDLQGMPTHAHKNRRNPPKGEWIERHALTAACMAIPRETFLRVGGFDEGYRNGFEDVDLCMKLRREGLRLYVSLRSVIRHHVSSSPGRQVNNERNSERFRERWSAFAAPYGRQEWPVEYFRRYARFWWRLNPQLACKALFLLLMRTFR